MVSAYRFYPSPSPKLNTFAIKTACTARHRHPLTILSLPISFVHFERTERRILGRSFCKSVESEAAAKGPKKIKTLLQQQCMSRRSEVRRNANLARGPGIRATESEGCSEREAEAALPQFDISRLEAYTERVPWEVLYVNALLENEEEEDQVIVFKGFSSSLSRAIPDDPSEPALPHTAAILSIDRLRAPYTPSKPRYIQQGISWREFLPLLQEKGL